MGETKTALARAASANDTIAERLGSIDRLLDQLNFSLRDPQNLAWFKRAMGDGMPAGLARLDGLAIALRAAPDFLDQSTQLDEVDLDYVAEQRALRVVLLIGRGEIPNFATPTLISLSPQERLLVDRLRSVWREGFSFGLSRAQRSSQNGRYTRN